MKNHSTTQNDIVYNSEANNYTICTLQLCPPCTNWKRRYPAKQLTNLEREKYGNYKIFELVMGNKAFCPWNHFKFSTSCTSTTVTAPYKENNLLDTDILSHSNGSQSPDISSHKLPSKQDMSAWKPQSKISIRVSMVWDCIPLFLFDTPASGI